jgi:thiol-disulfide isomerase/thioredoxin
METVTQPIGPDDIDLSYVPRLVPGLEMVTIGTEQIVVGDDVGVVALNATGALIFGFLDGEATLAELIDDFTEALGVDRDVVEHDVLEFARHLGANGLLDGVAPPPPELPGGWVELGGWELPTPIVVGAAVDDFTLVDLDGEERSLADFRGSRTLLVNWSPGCGYCVAIADELAALDPVLREHDVSLVLIASGDAESNRLLNEHHGVHAPTLLRDGTEVDPFSGTGTPAALLLDADGTLAEAMSVGANQVPVFARDLAGLDPAAPLGAGRDVDAPIDGELDDVLDHDEVRGTYLPAPGAMCGPGGGGGASNSTQWQGTRVYALGGYHVGLRHDGEHTAAILDRLFPGTRVNDRRAPDNYSVALDGRPSATRAGSSRSLKLLVHGSRQLVRSRSGSRVLAALLHHLSADLEPPAPSLAQVSASAVVRDGHALLLPAGLVDHVKVLQPRLAKRGMTVVDTPRVLLDLDARELVVPEPVVPFDPGVIDELDAQVSLGNELPWVRPGRYPLTAWFLVRSPDERGPLSPAVAVTTALPMVHVSDGDDVRSRIEQLKELFSAVHAVGIWYESAAELVTQVDAT